MEGRASRPPSQTGIAWLSTTNGQLFLTSLRSWPLSDHYRRNSAARSELALYLGPHRFRPPHHILQHLIHNIFLKDAQVPICLQIFLQRLQFQTELIGFVADHDVPKIRQASLWTDRGEFRIIHNNLVSGKLIRPSFDFREVVIEPGSGVLRGIAARCRTGRLWHLFIVPTTDSQSMCIATAGCARLDNRGRLSICDLRGIPHCI
jgi:hypothetical protein